MKAVWLAVCLLGALGSAQAAPLTLDEALATADRPHADWREAEADRLAAEADVRAAAAESAYSVHLEGALRGGQRPDRTWAPDHLGRLVVRQPLFDGGQAEGRREAALERQRAAEAAVAEAVAARRLAIMAAFFEARIAEGRLTVDTERMAVAFAALELLRERDQLGLIAPDERARAEAAFQTAREKRGDSQRALADARARLARLTGLPPERVAVLAEPVLDPPMHPLPDTDTLAARLRAANPAIKAAAARIASAEARLASLRVGTAPRIDAELAGAAFSRESSTRDTWSAGLVVHWPIATGGRQDARIQAAWAELEHARARHDQLAESSLEAATRLVHEIGWLRTQARPAAAARVVQQARVLDRSRAEYELELRASLGTYLADLQDAELEARQIDYRLALALARLEALIGRLEPAPRVSEDKQP